MDLLSIFIYFNPNEQTFMFYKCRDFCSHLRCLPQARGKPLKYERGETLPFSAAQHFTSAYWYICQVISICHGPKNNTTFD